MLQMLLEKATKVYIISYVKEKNMLNVNCQKLVRFWETTTRLGEKVDCLVGKPQKFQENVS